MSIKSHEDGIKQSIPVVLQEAYWKEVVQAARLFNAQPIAMLLIMCGTHQVVTVGQSTRDFPLPLAHTATSKRKNCGIVEPELLYIKYTRRIQLVLVW